MFQTGRDPVEIRGELGKIVLQTSEVPTTRRSLGECLEPSESSFATFGEMPEYCRKVGRWLDATWLGLGAGLVDSQVALIVEARILPPQALRPSMPVYSRLDWGEVFVLAEAPGITCVHDRERRSVALRVVPDADVVAAQPA